MSKFPVVSPKQVERVLLRLGYVRLKGKGSHRNYRHLKRTGKVTVPFHSGQDIEGNTLKSILKQAGLTVENFIKHL